MTVEQLAQEAVALVVDQINARKSPLADREIEEYLATKPLQLTATTDGAKAYKDADYVIIAAPTNYDSKKNFFDCSAVESVIELVLKVNPDATMIIKSTIPVGYTLQQPFLWLRRILPAKRHQTAACQLPGRTAEYDVCHCRK